MLASVLLGLVAAVACHREIRDRQGPSAEAILFAETVCAAAIECDCATPFESLDACEAHHRIAFGALGSTMSLDVECFDRFVDVLVQTPCAVTGTPAWGTTPGEGAVCFAFVGGEKHGAPCSPHWEVSPLSAKECGSGLGCTSGVCLGGGEATQLALGVGDACAPAGTPRCNSWGELYCADDGICRASGGLGEPCDSPWGCYEPDAITYCNREAGTCMAKAVVGASCDPHDYYACWNPDGADSTLATCDPVLGVCVAGRAPAICEGIGSPAPGKGL